MFIEEIWHDVQKGSGSILISISSQTLSLSPSNNDLVDMWPNLWCNSSKAIFCLDGNFSVFDISFISPKNVCLLCALCCNITEFFSFSPKFTVQNPLWNKQVCLKLIIVMIEITLLHKSGAKSTSCNVAIKLSPLLLQIFIRTWLFVSMWRDVRPQLQYVYMFIITNLE